MKKLVLVVISIFSISVVAIAQDSKVAVAFFKRKVQTIDSIFSKGPEVFASQNYSTSPTGKINYLYKIEKISSSYDVQATTSLISPYTGILVLTIKVSTNSHSGDVDHVGYSDPQAAKANHTLNLVTMAATLTNGVLEKLSFHTLTRMANGSIKP